MKTFSTNKRFTEMTTDRPALSVIITTECEKHGMPAGIACFDIPKATSWGSYPCICNDRAVAAGLNGQIDPRSVYVPTPKK